MRNRVSWYNFIQVSEQKITGAIEEVLLPKEK